MAVLRARYLLLLLVTTLVKSEPIPYSDDGSIIKALKDMSNETNADTLNLPANASSIRENITDTFSCENRTYGYYADVDNDCQVFHVCLPSQTPSGRNVTYRWSFICPNETVFNQVVLTCTRPIDSIDCKDSPDFYHLNMEIGKEANKTEAQKDRRKIQKRRPEKIRENIVMENEIVEDVIKEIINDELKNKLHAMTVINKVNDSPMLIESVVESDEPEIEDVELEQRKEEEMDRMIMERNMRHERQMKRGAFRFNDDV